jgi:hypothetical protein
MTTSHLSNATRTNPLPPIASPPLRREAGQGPLSAEGANLVPRYPVAAQALVLEEGLTVAFCE